MPVSATTPPPPRHPPSRGAREYGTIMVPSRLSDGFPPDISRLLDVLAQIEARRQARLHSIRADRGRHEQGEGE